MNRRFRGAEIGSPWRIAVSISILAIGLAYALCWFLLASLGLMQRVQPATFSEMGATILRVWGVYWGGVGAVIGLGTFLLLRPGTSRRVRVGLATWLATFASGMVTAVLMMAGHARLFPGLFILFGAGLVFVSWLVLLAVLLFTKPADKASPKNPDR